MIKHSTNSEIRHEERVQFCTFWIADLLYGVDLLDVKEINTETTFTHIYHSSENIRGYVNIRGKIYLILNLRKMLGFESSELDEFSRILLFKENVGPTFGVLVDRISDVIEVDGRDIEICCEDDQNDEKESHDCLIYGTCKLDDVLLTGLDAQKMLELV